MRYNPLTHHTVMRSMKNHTVQCKEIVKLVALDMNKVEVAKSSEKSLEAMRHFSEQYAKRTGTYFCAEPSVTAVVIEGLAKHKDDLGAPLCPCRHYEDKAAEVSAAFWNCPCVPMRERKECHCMLFLTTDNDFAGEKQDITLDEILAVRDTM